MLPLLELFAPLLKKRDTYYVAAIVVVSLFAWRSLTRARADEAALAARPKVETRIDVQTKTVTMQGPERIVEKVVKGEVVERIVYKDAATTTTGTEKEYDRTVAPACPAAPKAPWRYAGALVDPFAETKLVGLRGGVTLYDRVDLGLSARSQPNAVALEAGIRF